MFVLRKFSVSLPEAKQTFATLKSADLKSFQKVRINLFDKPSAPGGLLVFAFFMDSSSSSIVKFLSNISFSLWLSLALATIGCCAVVPRKFLTELGSNCTLFGFLYRVSNEVQMNSSLAAF